MRVEVQLGVSPQAGVDDLAELATEDLYGIEIVRAGGPYHGLNSPPKGDFVSLEDLQAAAASAIALTDEISSPVKLGHNLSQEALRDAGLLGSDGAPAAGWVDNLRVVGRSLVADLRKVPRVVAQLVKSGAYRTRSIEFYRDYTDKAGAKHPFVICGLALLGARQPAVKGLDDFVKLYAGDVGQEAAACLGESEAKSLVISGAFGEVGAEHLPMADADREWSYEDALGRVRAWAGAEGEGELAESAQSRLRQAFLWWNPEADNTIGGYGLLVADIIDGDLVAVPAAIYAAAEGIDGMEVGENDKRRVRDALSRYYGRLGRTPPWGDRSGDIFFDDDFFAAPKRPPSPNPQATQEARHMPELTPAALEALGLGEDADESAVLAAITGLSAKQDKTELAESKLSELENKVGVLEAQAQEGIEAKSELAGMRKEKVLGEAQREFKFREDEREKWSDWYDAAPQMVSEQLEAMPSQLKSTDEFGTDDKGDTEGRGEDGFTEDERYSYAALADFGEES